jgi:hypothetical protein
MDGQKRQARALEQIATIALEPGVAPLMALKKIQEISDEVLKNAGPGSVRTEQPMA